MYYNYDKEPQNSIGNYYGPYISAPQVLVLSGINNRRHNEILLLTVMMAMSFVWGDSAGLAVLAA